MRISGNLVSFPDLGAADLMSDHLEQIVQAEGPGKILCRISLPRTLLKTSSVPPVVRGGFARKMVEFTKLEEGEWLTLWSSTTESYQALEEIYCKVVTAGTFKCTLMNLSGTEGQFSLESTFHPNLRS